MKTIITLITIIILAANTILSQTTYTWIGANNTNWSSGANWNPTRAIGQANDILLFNNGQTLTIQNTQQQTVGQIKVSNNTKIILVPASGNPKTISIMGCDGEDFTVENGSALEILCNDTKLGIYLKTGATAKINGTITLRGLQNHYLNAQDAQSFTFLSGSTLTQKSAGNIFTNAGTPNAIVFENGSKFVIADNSASNPFGLNAPESKVMFNSGSTYTQQCTNPASFSLNGRNYSNIEITENIEVNESLQQDIEVNNLSFSGQSALVINNTNNEKSFIVNGNLNLSNSVLTTSNVNVKVNGNITRSSGYVNGKLSKLVSQQKSNVTFEIGSETGYTPVTLTFSNISKSGYVTIKSENKFYGFLADSSKILKRYWSIQSNEVVYSNLEASFKYLSSDFTGTFTEQNELNMLLKKLVHNSSLNQNECSIKSIDTTNNIFTAENIFTLGDFSIVNNNTQNESFNNNLTLINENGSIPNEYTISQNYPNPFNPSTKIDYTLPIASKVTIKIFDINGKEVNTIINETKEAGSYTLSFNASNLSSGVYFYHITAVNNAQSYDKTMKMIIVK